MESPRRALGAMWLLGGLLGSGAQAAGPEMLVRVHLAKDASTADALRVRDTLVSYGGVVKGYARGEVFVLAVPAEAVPALGSVHKVARVDPLPIPEARSRAAVPTALTPQQRVSMMPRLCLPAPSPQQAARTAKLAQPAPAPVANALSVRRAALAGAIGLPASADNSLSPYFPPIGDQEGRSSCVAWAVGYYWGTYAQAADEDLDVSGVWLPRDPPCDILTDGKFDPVKFAACLPNIKDPPRPSRATEHIGSPAFLYPLIHTLGTDPAGNPTDDAGAYMPDAFAVLNNSGIGSWKFNPYDPWLYARVVLEWPTEAQWLEAMPRRTRSSHWMDLSATAGFDALKQHLANGNLAVAGFQQYENVMLWGWDNDCQQRAGACPGMSENVLYEDGLKHSGGHAITLVGYDDGKRYYDATSQQWRQGAFLVANSASPAWGVPNAAGGPAKGFFWMAYDYARSHLYDVMYAEDRPRYRPKMHASVLLQSSQRANWSQLYAGVGAHAGFYWPAFARFVTSDVMPPAWELSPRPFEANKPIVIDMTDAVPFIDPAMPVPLLFVGYGPADGGRMESVEFRRYVSAPERFVSPDPSKSVSGAGPHGVMCTNVLQTGDVNLDRLINRDDVEIVTLGLNQPAQCLSDPRDMDRSGRINVLDARKVAVRCTFPGCAK